MKSAFRWGWLALAAALVCLPAHAQSCAGEVDADCYSTIDIDGAGNITGASVTILPYWYGMFDLEAYAEGLLEGPSSEIEDVDAYDDEEGYAEADTSGTASTSGDYVQYGYHWVLDPYDGLADSEIGETDTDAYWAGSPACDYPCCGETEADGGYPTAPFHETLAQPIYGDFSGRSAQESDGGGGGSYDGCFNAAPSSLTTFYGVQNFYLVPTVGFPIHPDGTYGDYNGYSDGQILFYQYIVPNNGPSVLPCGNSQTQVMTMFCPYDDSSDIWVINGITNTIYQTYVTGSRAGLTWTEPYVAAH